MSTKPKKIPQRMCVSCRTRRDKKDLIRVTATEDGNLVYDPTGKLPGRGAYLCKNEECIRTEIRAHRIARGLKSGGDMDELAKEILALCQQEQQTS